MLTLVIMTDCLIVQPVGTFPPPTSQASVSVALLTDIAGPSVQGGTVVHYGIAAHVIDVGDSGCAGLAAVTADLQQYPLTAFGSQPPLALTPGTRGPDLANFDRPLGIANPVPGQITSSASAFGGTVLDTQGYGYPGLIQIGGAQNTFGMPGTNYLGSSQTPVAGVGLQAQGQVIASGSFIAPTVPGEYALYLENVYVNYLQTVGGPGVPSEVASATVFVGDPVFFTVVPCLVDYNHDTVVNSDDLGDFVTDYFTDPPIPGPGGYASACPENDPPYDEGYKANFTLDGSGQCFPPNSDNLGDFITAYFDSPC